MNKMKKILSDDSGFTLLEMVLVVLIIAALLLLFIPNISNTQQSAQNKRDEALVQVVGTQAELYRLDHDLGANESVSLSQLIADDYLEEEQGAAVRKMDSASSKLSSFSVTVDGSGE